MAQFDLKWLSPTLIINPNCTGQIASYRQKSVGGAWISTGFTPSGVIPKYIETARSPALAENKVWEFKVSALCTVGGPQDDDNGVQEQIKFACIDPQLSKTDHTATITLDVSGTDIAKATFILHKTVGGATIGNPVTVGKTGTAITYTAIDVTDSTSLYWEVVLHALVNGQDVTSSPCISPTFSTIAAVCDPITNITATVTEV